MRIYHEYSKLFPLIEGKEFQLLKNDIEINGLNEPVCLDKEGKIIDGRNRYRACIELGVEPKYITYTGNNILELIISKNLMRRHLNESQRAVVASKLANMPKHLHKNDTQICVSQPEAAKMLNVSPRLLQNVKEIERMSPELIQQIESGEKNVTQVFREVKRDAVKRQVVEFPSDKYRVLYADPPWEYNDECNDGAVQSGGSKGHYPTMTLSELCLLPIHDISDDNSVLFLWATSPMLPEALQVAKSWGFTYKSSFIWDKVKHNMGHYNSVRHELLLICTKGSCLPDSKELIDSVQSIERTKHSVKPEEFRIIIDKLYPNGNRIEFFARRKVNGWETWGDEIG